MLADRLLTTMLWTVPAGAGVGSPVACVALAQLLSLMALVRVADVVGGGRAGANRHRRGPSRSA